MDYIRESVILPPTLDIPSPFPQEELVCFPFRPSKNAVLYVTHASKQAGSPQ